MIPRPLAGACRAYGRHKRGIDRAVGWSMLVGTAGGLALALRGQKEAIAAFDWSLSWRLFLFSVAAFAVAPLVQAVSFWLILRLLTGETPFADAMVVWARSYLVRYAPSGALSVVLRLRERQRLRATHEQVLLATAYEHLAALASGACVCLAAFLAAGGAPPLVGFAIALPALALTVAVRPGFAGRLLQNAAARRGLNIPTLLRGRQLAMLVALNAAAWPVTGAAVYVLVDGLAPARPAMAWLTGAYALGYLVGFVAPFSPGGLGSREATVIAALVGRYGTGVAAALAIAIRLANTLGELVCVGLIETLALVGRVSRDHGELPHLLRPAHPGGRRFESG